MKETIWEEDIKSVIMSDGSAMCVYAKMEDDTKYVTTYSYQYLSEGTTYCPYCGNIYNQSENDICPLCHGENIDTVSYKDMPGIIMDMINDHVKVCIMLKGDNKEHIFFIPEKKKIID